jgi:hypothetical protein
MPKPPHNQTTRATPFGSSNIQYFGRVLFNACKKLKNGEEPCDLSLIQKSVFFLNDNFSEMSVSEKQSCSFLFNNFWSELCSLFHSYETGPHVALFWKLHKEKLIRWKNSSG